MTFNITIRHYDITEPEKIGINTGALECYPRSFKGVGLDHISEVSLTSRRSNSCLIINILAHCN